LAIRLPSRSVILTFGGRSGMTQVLALGMRDP
jgi:hypothetical protein